MMFIAKYPLPNSVKITGFSLAMDKSLSTRICFSTHSGMRYIETRLITYIYNHKHQFFIVNETQTYRHNAAYKFIQPEQ